MSLQKVGWILYGLLIGWFALDLIGIPGLVTRDDWFGLPGLLGIALLVVLIGYWRRWNHAEETFMTNLHIAQVNIARMNAPLDDPSMAGFVARLDEINALADRSAGFVWRLQTSAGNATYLRPYEDDRILFNLSVWETLDQLQQYVYRSAHAELIRQRREWFEKFAGAYLAVWWIPAGHRPSVEEAKKRLAHLDVHGPTAFAFTIKKAFPSDEAFIRTSDDDEHPVELSK